MSVVVGIDASRIRSGGGIRHVIGILGAGDPRAHGVRAVHVWGYDALLASIPDAPWLTKHSPAALRGSILRQAWWQRRAFPGEAKAAGVDILFNVDAGSVCRGHPSVTMSQDLMSYEPGEMGRYFPSRAWLRNVALRYVQAWSLQDADGAIFLTQYAADVIQRTTGPLARVGIVPLGVDAAFRGESASPVSARGGAMRCIYVSQTDLYKHQWHVVRAIAELRRRGHDVTLTLAGGGNGRPQRILDRELERSDPKRTFVVQRGFVRADELPGLLREFDLFVFASSCENMPVTLLEGMASGLPIACSDRGPMPDVLRDGGVYFDPEDDASIAAAIEKLIRDSALRASLARRAAELSREFSWERCAVETWAFLRGTFDAATQSRR